ncbi:hypothetical protein C8Q78DRAFT_1080823 [Trametes maxima]|nr:hypothetical protein C8Q78DRAFT_1080823 [Trametes maxima]
MDSLVSQHQHQHQHQAYSSTPYADSYPSQTQALAYASASADPARAYDPIPFAHQQHQQFPIASSSSSSSAQQQQHLPGSGSSSSPSLQIQTATPAPHEHEPDEQTAHPSRGVGVGAGAVGTGPGAGAFNHHTHPHPHAADSPERMDVVPTHPQQQQSIADALTDAHGGLSRPLTHQERELLAHLDRLKFFLATAPSRWNADASVAAAALPALPLGMGAGMGFGSPMGMGMGMNIGMTSASASSNAGVPAGHPHSTHPALNRFLLPNQEYVSCVLWGGLYHITGTDIVRALVFRFEAFGRPVRNMKKFEEGVFSDLRNLKPGVDACLEEPKSPFLDLLFKYQCIRTQKKQKVFYWFSVPHDRLFLDALERDLKREKMGLEPTTTVVGEPALSFTYDPKRSLYEQFSKAHGARDGEGELEAAVRHADEVARGGSDGDDSDGRAASVASTSASASTSEAEHSASDADENAEDGRGQGQGAGARRKGVKKPSALGGPNSPFFPMFSLFEGSPTYKQRRKKVPKSSSSNGGGGGSRKTPPTSAAVADAHAFAQHNGGGGGGEFGGYAYPEPQLDRFGRDMTRLSAEEMFRASSRGDFGANPDIVGHQKERQRRAMEAQAHEFTTAQQGKLPFLGGLSGPGVPAAPAYGAQDLVYGVPGAAGQAQASTSVSALAGSMDYASQQQQYGQQIQHSRPHLEQRHTYPTAADFAQPPPHQQQHALARSGTDPYSTLAAGPITTGWANGVDATTAMGGEAPPRTKVFVCPLLSCGRMFKRMEHLRRHLRTHTLERPFQCEQCQKRFSRSDNLAQHIRTHDRRAAAFAGQGSGAGAGMGMGMGMGMAVGVPDGADADAEDEMDELGSDDLDGELQYMANGITNVRMCEVEVQGQVHEVHGDEEGLLAPAGAVALTPSAPQQPSNDAAEQSQGQDMYYDSTGQILRASPEATSYMADRNRHSPEAQWVSVPQSSQHQHQPAPASAMSTSTAGTMQLPHARLDASYHTGTMGDYVTSISAPSHKLTFDHPSLYPAELALSNSHGHGHGHGAGPIRRHRSATPSIPRYGESIRRPYSAALSDSGNASAQGAPAAAASRSYHPYAVHGHHQVSHSAQSSPMAYTVPLGYEAAAAVRPGVHSRSNSSGQLQDHMRHLLTIDQMDAESMAYAAASAVPQDVAVTVGATVGQGYAGMYRTDSPMPFNGVGETYDMDVTQQQPVYNVGLTDAQYVAQQQQQRHQQQSAYYQHPHHSL